MSDEQKADAVESAAFAGSAGQVRLRDFDFRIDEQGRLVISGSDLTSLDILIPGRFTKEDIQLSIDNARGLILRVRKRG
ncbi:hypothetical protein [Dyella sp. GSA-30]|uniref:hypothetical protein n=1 Tax=Dyella sp. GSA-30 TaxID=2994496 RepID=UPI0024905B1F|nr:hypothetical protein [Dyella sp. GSA-30]BDU22177.1 hypothetical protein DYGSA30_36340 [Dyella sp. GSA-30]